MFLLRGSHGQRGLAGYSPWGCKESDTTEAIKQQQMLRGFHGGSDSKECAFVVGDLGLIPGLGRCPGEGNGNPLQYSCLENSMNREGPGRLQSMKLQRVRLSD